MIFSLNKSDVSFIKIIAVTLICSVISVPLFFICGITMILLLLKDIGTGTIISPPISTPYTSFQIVELAYSTVGFIVSLLLPLLAAYLTRNWVKDVSDSKSSRITYILCVGLFPIVLVFCSSITLIEISHYKERLNNEIIQKVKNELDEKPVEVKILDMRAVKFNEKYKSLDFDIVFQIRNIPLIIQKYEFKVIDTSDQYPLNFANSITYPNGGIVIAKLENNGWKFSENSSRNLISENPDKITCRYHYSYDDDAIKFPKYLTVKLTLNVKNKEVEVKDFLLPINFKPINSE